MFIINDIELLERLGKHKILDFLLPKCSIAVSAIRLHNFSFSKRKIIKQYPLILELHVDDDFESWRSNKPVHFAQDELSSVYVTMTNPKSCLLLSTDDGLLAFQAKASKIATINFDNFIIGKIKDQRIIQLYNLIKVA